MLPIRRVRPTSDQSPPWAGISFAQPVDSDDLHEHLKKLYPYPQYTTLRQRKHMAAIDFLKHEFCEMQATDSNVTKRPLSSNTGPATLRAVDPSSRASNGHRFLRVHSGSRSPTGSTQSSTIADHQEEHEDYPNSFTQPQPLATSKMGPGQQYVFSVANGHAFQPKRKRKMTTAEKAAYKKTRRHGACSKCKRQKGKCTHIPDMMEDSGDPHESEVLSKINASPEVETPKAASATDSRLGNAVNDHRYTHVQSQPPSSPFQASQMLQPRRGSAWGQDLGEEHQHEISGYVPPVTSNPYNMSLHETSEAPWNHGPTSIHPHALDNGYLGYMDHPDQVDGFLISPSDEVLPSGSTRYHDYLWPLPSDYVPNETEPG